MKKYSLGQGNYEISDKNVKRWCWLCKFYYLSLKAKGDKVKETSLFPNFPSGFYSSFFSLNRHRQHSAGVQGRRYLTPCGAGVQV